MYQPYDYQQACLDTVQAVRDRGRALVVMATGLGKSVVMAFDAKKWRSQQGGRVLFLCHNNDILYQAKATFEAVNGTGNSYGYFNGIEKDYHEVDFLFASLQTMERYKDLFSVDEFAYVMVDESHHSRAGTFRSTIEYFKPKFLLGVTATPNRLDDLDIRQIFGEEVYSLPLEEAMARGLLTPVDYRLLTDEIQLTEALRADDGTRISIAELNRKIFIPRRDQEIAKIIACNVAELENPRIIIFCSSIAHCQHLARFIPNSFAIHSGIPHKERSVRFEMFRQGLIGTVLVVDAFNEGVDIPQANMLVFLRSTVSQTIFLQQLGRGLRKSDGKNKVVVLDFVSNCERIKMVHSLWKDVDERVQHNAIDKKKERGSILPMTLNISSVEFIETIVPLLNIIDRVRQNFYITWEEASAAARRLGIKTKKEYRLRYKEDPRLCSVGNLDYSYADFPGLTVFLGGQMKDFYPTWQAASRSARALGARNKKEYALRYKEDPELHSNPDRHYADFPGWCTFLDKYYPTWQDASKAVHQLSIENRKEYLRRYKEDEKLNTRPDQHYADFPGWDTFLGRKTKDLYPTWEEAFAAIVSLRLTSSNLAMEYRLRYREDPRLPADPWRVYSHFPGWAKLRGKFRQ